MKHSCVEDLLFAFMMEGDDPEVNDVIEPIVKKLESKGYNVKYSSPGYDNTRFSNDRDKDGIINGKLVSTAKIVFGRNYRFETTPQGWEWKVLASGDKALYVKALTYNKKQGTEKEAFEKWQQYYLSTIRDWVVKLPKAGTDNDQAPDTNFDAT